MEAAIRPTVFIIDDDPAIRDALSALLRLEDWSVAAFASAAAFLQAALLDHPGCLLLDVRLPGMSGLELQNQLQTRGCRLPVLFMTAHGDVSLAVRAMKAGAFDFFEKPFQIETLRRRIGEALALDAQQRELERCVRAAAARLARLSPREREVLERVATGQYNKVIAAALELGLSTVELHRKRGMEKLQIRSLADLIRLLAWEQRAPLG